MLPNQLAVDAVMSFVTHLRNFKRSLLKDDFRSVFHVLHAVRYRGLPRYGVTPMGVSTTPPTEMVCPEYW